LHYKKEELYTGPYLDNAPDIIFKLNEKYEGGVGTDTLIANGSMSGFKKWSGYHLPEGVFMAAGPQIKQGSSPESLSIADIAPTLLYLLGEAIPNNMDGKVCLEILEAPVAKPRYIGAKETQTCQKECLDEDEDRKRALRALGYME